MTAVAAPLPARRIDLLGPWRRTSVRVLSVVTLTVVAYHHSLFALTATLGSDTPMAYLGLVPVLALGVALVKGRARPGEGRLPHRQADWIIGLPLLAVAALVATVLPDRLSYAFWTNRIDMIGLPFFVAGMVSLLLGSRVLHRVRLPVAALVLAWPLPYELMLDRVLVATSAVTLAGVRWAVPLLGLGRDLGGTLFTVGDGAGAFTVNVAPQCAGASSAIGFLIVGGAVTAIVGGRRRVKLAWLATGVVFQLALNVVRVVAVFAAGDRYGERVAIDWLHPYIGLVLFTASVAALVALLPRFGMPLRVAAPDPMPVACPPRVAVGGAALSCAVILGLLNAGLARFDPFLGIGAAAPYRALTAGPATVTGWVGRHTDTIGWAKPYFGATSTWHRQTYARTAGASRSVFVDVVGTDDLRSFSRYGLRACYRFHDYDVLTSPDADVGAPARAQTLAYRDGEKAWAIVSWVWPVGAAAGGRYERVVVIGAFDGTRAGADRARSELVSFSKSLVRQQRA